MARAERERLWSQTLSHRIRELAWSPEGRHLAASYDGRDSDRQGKAEFGVWLLDAGNGAVEATFTDHEQMPSGWHFTPQTAPS